LGVLNADKVTTFEVPVLLEISSASNAIAARNILQSKQSAATKVHELLDKAGWLFFDSNETRMYDKQFEIFCARFVALLFSAHYQDEKVSLVDRLSRRYNSRLWNPANLTIICSEQDFNSVVDGRAIEKFPRCETFSLFLKRLLRKGYSYTQLKKALEATDREKFRYLTTKEKSSEEDGNIFIFNENLESLREEIKSLPVPALTDEILKQIESVDAKDQVEALLRDGYSLEAVREKASDSTFLKKLLPRVTYISDDCTDSKMIEEICKYCSDTKNHSSAIFEAKRKEAESLLENLKDGEIHVFKEDDAPAADFVMRIGNRLLFFEVKYSKFKHDNEGAQVPSSTFSRAKFFGKCDLFSEMRECLPSDIASNAIHVFLTRQDFTVSPHLFPKNTIVIEGNDFADFFTKSFSSRAVYNLTAMKSKASEVLAQLGTQRHNDKTKKKTSDLKEKTKKK